MDSCVALANFKENCDISKMLDEINGKYQENVHNKVATHHKDKAYCDKKPIAQTLKITNYVF